MMNPPGHFAGSSNMRRSPFFAGLLFLLLFVTSGIVSADPLETITTPATAGGSVYFDISPSGAMIWLDGAEVGASPFTYFSEKTGTMDVRVRKSGFTDYRGTVTVVNGTRVIFHAVLTAAPSQTTPGPAPVVPLTSVTIAPKSMMSIPTPWPTSTPASPIDPGLVIGAVALGTAVFLVRGR
jgi:hypothetical protein